MIQANELRIGNIVFLDYKKENVKVYDLSETGCNGLNFNEFSAVDISEEILFNLGWVWNPKCDSYEKYPNGDSRLFIAKESNVSGNRVVFNYILSAKIAEVKYVHQLQNLYLSLIGRELETSILIKN